MLFANLLVASLSYCAILFASYLFFFGLTRHWFARIKIYYEIALGLLMGVILLFASLAMSTLLSNVTDKTIIYLLQTTSFWIAIMFISRYTSIGILISNILVMALFPFVFPNLFPNDYDPMVIAILCVSYVMPITLSFASIWVKKIKFMINWISTTLVCMVIAVIYCLISFQDKNLMLTKLMAFSLWMGSAYLTYGFVTLVNQIYNHALKLQNILTYDNTYYINNVGAEGEIKQLIQKTNTQHGFYINFFISNYDKFESIVKNEIKEFIVNHITDEVYQKFTKNFNKDIVFFKTNYKLFGMFIPSPKDLSEDIKSIMNSNGLEQRDIDDPLSIFERIFKTIKNKFKIEGYYFEVKLRSVISLYGLQSNNLETLASQNQHYSLHEEKLISKNIAFLTNPIEINEKIKQNRQIVSLSEITPINQNSVLFEPIYSIDNKNMLGYYLNDLINGVEVHSELFKDDLKTIQNYGLESIFLRYLAFQNLKAAYSFKNNIQDRSLFLQYDSRFVSEEHFNVDEFFSKIKNTKVSKSNIVMVFDITNEVQNISLLEKNVKELKKFGIKMALKNFGSIETNYHLVEYYQPDYLILENEIISKVNMSKENEDIIRHSLNVAKKIDAEIIAGNVSTYMIYKTLQNIGVKYINGNLIGSSTIAQPEISDEIIYLLNK